MKAIDTFFNILLDACIVLAKILLIAMTLIICVSVFVRYVLNGGIKWSNEVAMLFMVWFGLISTVYGVKHKLHLSVEIFYNAFPPKLQLVCQKLSFALVSFAGIIMFTYGILLMKSTWHNVMTATRWPSATLYAMVPISGLLIAYFSFADFIGYKSTYKMKQQEVKE